MQNKKVELRIYTLSYLVSWILQDDKIFDNKIDLEGTFSCIIPLVILNKYFVIFSGTTKSSFKTNLQRKLVLRRKVDDSLLKNDLSWAPRNSTGD